MKKKKEDPKVHEEKYISYLEKQLDWVRKQDILDKPLAIEELKYKLSKARLKLKVL